MDILLTLPISLVANYKCEEPNPDWWKLRSWEMFLFLLPVKKKWVPVAQTTHCSGFYDGWCFLFTSSGKIQATWASTSNCQRPGGGRKWLSAFFCRFVKFTSLTDPQITNHVICWAGRQRSGLQCFLFLPYLGWRGKIRCRRGADLWRGFGWRGWCRRRCGREHKVKNVPQTRLRGLQA